MLDLLTSAEWGEPSVPRTGWLQFELSNGAGQIDGAFEFRDPLTPFEDCVRRRVENCVVSECAWIADQYAPGASMEGDAELATLEQLRLSSNPNGSAEFDVYDPFAASSARESAAFLDGGEVPPGGVWWGELEGFERELSTGVWSLKVSGGSLDGLSSTGITLPEPHAIAVSGGVSLSYHQVGVSIQAGEDYQLSWQPSPDAEFFRVYSERGDTDTVQCFFDGESGEGTIPGDVTASFERLELSVANLQLQEFGDDLPRGRQLLVILSAAAVLEAGSTRAVRLIPQ